MSLQLAIPWNMTLQASPQAIRVHAFGFARPKASSNWHIASSMHATSVLLVAVQVMQDLHKACGTCCRWSCRVFASGEGRQQAYNCESFDTRKIDFAAEM